MEITVFLLLSQIIKMRCFVSINLSDEAVKEIEKIQACISKFGCKKTEPRNFNLTLKFLGKISEEKVEAVKIFLRKIKFKKFILSSKEIGYFDKGDKGIIWISLENSDRLQKEIDDKLKNLFAKEKRFMYHLTIARVKYLKNKKEFIQELKKIKIPELKFEVSEFCLMKSILKSIGPEYNIIEKYNLI